MLLENKKIVITGAASGIGAETAKMLKARGAAVIGVDRNEPKENTDSAGFFGNPGRAGRRGREDHGSSGTSGRYRAGDCLYVQ